MYLKEIDIFGFKSFPEKTNMKFEPGITVIVGPNGCGKSNTLDAIKWALGEQSPKSLRGSKMEDIIFNGTDNHPPLGYAEVGLTFSNEDNYLPIDYKEVSIARRLYRSGESEYYLNKSLVRLKDIEELFMGTGIGESTYSFIEQGKIDLFLSYKPEDKRVIFDEASGIVKYKERKRETLRRLEEADENLVRLEDIILEVRRQIRYLDRQVEKARQYKEAQERLIECEKKIAALQFNELEAKNNDLTGQLNSFKEKEEAEDKELAQAKASQDDLDVKLKELRRQLEEANSLVISLGAQIDSSTSHINVYQQRIKELEMRLLNLEQSRNDLGGRLVSQDKRLEEEKKQFGVIDENVKKIEEETASSRREKISLDEQIKEAAKIIEEEKVKIFEWESKKSQLHNSFIEAQANLTTLVKRKQRLLLDKAKLEGLLKEKQAELQKAQVELSDLETTLNILRDKKSNLAAKEKILSSRKEELRSRLIEKEKDLFELNSCYEFLKDFRMKYDSFSTTKKITIVFDEEPKNINKLVASLKDIAILQEGNVYKACVEAKVVSLEENQLEGMIAAANREIEETKSSLAELEEELKKVSYEASLENTQMQGEEKHWQEKVLEKENLDSQWRRLREEAELTDQEMASSLEAISALEQKQKEKEAELALVDSSLAASQEALHRSGALTDKNSARIQEIDVETARKESQLQSFAGQREALHSKISLLENERANALKDLEAIEKEKKEDGQRIESFNGHIGELNLKIEGDKVRVEQFSLKKSEIENQENFSAGELEEKRKAQNLIEKELEAIRSDIYNKKMEIQSVEYEKDKIKDYLRQVYQVEFDHAAVTDIIEALDVLREVREKLQKKKESLGEVNLVAIDEFEELKKRDDFLAKQKDDLLTAKENLKKAITKINKTSKELFLETFAKIEEEFKKNFRFLFNGGRAQLILIDPDNVLESGVEIEVQPPGKKLQNVSLLSGGEKALTAIALIFAIFRVRPSPLCVLDEIDAPLDEANVDRFNNILREFASFSQFVLITHNKKTMANSDVLYGVTMQEKGVSKLVSVKFGSDKRPQIKANPLPVPPPEPSTLPVSEEKPVLEGAAEN
jgi:chromosome segregation protein